MKKRKKTALWLLMTAVLLCCLTGSVSALDGEPQSLSLELAYDDHYTLEGYSILSLESTQVTSSRVIEGKVSNSRDESAVTVLDTHTLKATGIGTAQLLLLPDGQETAAAEGENAANEEAAVLLNVTVNPAKLTVMLLAGQSNMDGYAPTNDTYYPESSVLCERGQVYSTFCPKTTDLAVKITGIAGFTACTAKNAESFVPESLTGTKSLAGKSMKYTVDALTASGKGKQGLDAAAGYEWNRLSGEKVWLINTAWGGSSIATWVPGASNYERTAAVMTACMQVLDSEVMAGHYVLSHKLMLWCQGGADRTKTVNFYMSSFREMMDALRQSFGIECCGIITSRSGLENQLNADGIVMLNHRVAQYAMGFSREYPDTFIVSHVNEQWVSDEQTAAYFSLAYPEGVLSYPLRDTAQLYTVPSLVTDVHPEKHYTQLGHNENGLDAARNLYAAVTHVLQPWTLRWRGADGLLLPTDEDPAQTTLTSEYGEELTLYALCEPMYEAKSLSFSYDEEALSYDRITGRLTVKRTGTLPIEVSDERGQTARLLLEIPKFDTPCEPSVTVLADSLRVKLSAVKGAKLYRVYKSVDGGEWSVLFETEELSFEDTEVESSHIYAYSAQVISQEGIELSDRLTEAAPVRFIEAPRKLRTENTADGVSVSWSDCPGAAKYGVYYYKDGKWTKIANTTQTSYTDKTVSSGEEKRYTVRCLASNGKTHESSYDRQGVAALYIAPVQPALSVTNGGICISWTKPAGAQHFRVLIKGIGAWKTLTETDDSTCLYDRPVNGRTYSVQVCCIDENGACVSSTDGIGISMRYLASAKLRLCLKKDGGLRLSWKANTAATGYILYRAENGGKLTRVKKLKAATACTYEDDAVTSGTAYEYVIVTYLKTDITVKSAKSTAVRVTRYF